MEEIPNNHLGCIPNLVNNGITYQPQLGQQDFWTINSINKLWKKNTFPFQSVNFWDVPKFRPKKQHRGKHQLVDLHWPSSNHTRKHHCIIGRSNIHSVPRLDKIQGSNCWTSVEWLAGRKHSKNLWPVSWRQECPHWVSFVEVELTWFKRNKPLAISKVTQSLLLCKLFGNGEVGRWLVLNFWCKTTAHKVLDVQATCWNVNHKIGIRLSIAWFNSRPYQLVIAGFLPSTAFQHL